MTGLDLTVTAVVLGSALLHATWNTLVKTGGGGPGERLWTLTLIHVAWLTLGAVGVILTPLPARPAWFYLGLSAAVHWVYIGGLLAMYRAGDLSLVYPLARGSAPLALAGVSALLLGEVLAPAGWLGVAAVSLGIAVLVLGARGNAEAAVGAAGSPWPQGRAMACALFTGLTIVTYTLVDGVGVRHSGTPTGYAAWLFLFQGAGWVSGWLAWRAVAGWPMGFVPGKKDLPQAMLAGAFSLAAYAMVIWALERAPVAMVSALRETGVIFAALIGWLLLKEPGGIRRLAAAMLVAAGVALLHV